MSRRLLLLAAMGVVGVLAAQDDTCKCPTPATQENFEPDKYLGKWYEMMRVTRSYERDGQCGTAEYSWVDKDKSAVNVVNTNFLPSQGATYTVNLLATPVIAAEGKFVVTWPSQPLAPPSNYWVLSTDYTSYSVVYACGDAATGQNLPSITLWVLARDPAKFTADTEKTVNDILKSKGFEQNNLVSIRHDCPSSTCKDCTTSKPSLDLSKLAGRWIETQHSPFASNSDKESCTVADLTATSDGVKLFAQMFVSDDQSKNLGVGVNLTLIGKWTDSDKKNGQFTVTQGFNGDSNDRLCVIDTDYSNWAVISVCGAPASSKAKDGVAAVPTNGVFVMSRKRGLTAEHQMKANEAVVSAGVLAASMLTSPSSPCTEAALDAASVPSATAALLLSALAMLSLRNC